VFGEPQSRIIIESARARPSSTQEWRSCHQRNFGVARPPNTALLPARRSPGDQSRQSQHHAAARDCRCPDQCLLADRAEAHQRIAESFDARLVARGFDSYRRKHNAPIGPLGAPSGHWSGTGESRNPHRSPLPLGCAAVSTWTELISIPPKCTVRVRGEHRRRAISGRRDEVFLVSKVLRAMPRSAARSAACENSLAACERWLDAPAHGCVHGDDCRC